MPTTITLAQDVDLMRMNGLVLAHNGKYKHLIRITEDGKLDFHGFFCPVAYVDNKSIGYGRLSITEILGDEETGAPSFISEMGLICINYGANGIELYDGMSAENKALYEAVKPPIRITDTEGNETGETRFNYHVVIDG